MPGIRLRLSAGHKFARIDRAIEAFTKIGRKYEILGKTKEEIIERHAK